MRFLYEVVIRLYRFAIILASLFNQKASGWVNGRKRIFSDLHREIDGSGEKLAWFHCASLGEFEQGRPIIEKFKNQFPDYKILITFFSPSGYEVRKDYAMADYVFYLPADTRINALRFVKIVKPDVLILVKYEYWYNYIDVLWKNNIPIYVVSGVFRKSQHFFKWYGFWFVKQLKKIHTFFVQDQKTADLLRSIGIDNMMISGDTRFDRVVEIAKKSMPIKPIGDFCAGKRIIVAGSSWPADESMLANAKVLQQEDVKLIVVPHEVHPQHISDVLNVFGASAVTLSQFITNPSVHYSVLVVDKIGILSSIYQYADIAYIGGGFGKGIHNILEAAAYSIPVLFGPKNEKFLEAAGLKASKSGFEITDEVSLNTTLEKLLNSPEDYAEACSGSATYISENKGATKLFLSNLKL